MRKVVVSLAITLAAVWPAVPAALARDLTFEERVAAQEAIERVYYSHQIGATRPFEEAVPRAVLEDKVRKYLKESVALERFWKTPVTAEMLRREAERQARGSRMPERLREIYATLGNDVFLIQECLARPALVGRLTGNFFAFDQVLHTDERSAADRLRASLVSGEIDPAANHSFRTVTDFVRADVGDVDNGSERTAVARDGLATVAELDPQAGGTGPEGSEPQVSDRPTGSNRTHLSSAEFERLRAQLVNGGGGIGPLTEEREGYVIRVLLDETPDELLVATYFVEKRSRDDWWVEVRNELEESRIVAVAIESGSPPELARCANTEGGPGGDTSEAPDARASGTQENHTVRCVPDDTWDNGILDDMPDPRYAHTAVWTGSVMVVWGGTDLSGDYYYDTGRRYDPATDTWTATSSVGAPYGRYGNTAVWTGSVMVVWGGTVYSGDYYFNTGGRYDPATDTWKATSTAGSPSARSRHTAVWTGSVMVVWGGYTRDQAGHTNFFNTGGRYDPATDTWAATSIAGAPSARSRHSAAWTGNVMVVWGGSDLLGSGFDEYLNTGGRYDPTTDTWTATSTVGAPSGRYGHTVVWTGSVMVVWGGSGYYPDFYLDTGGRYDPATDTWTATSTVGAPPGRDGHTAAWTGSVMVVWGGRSDYPDFYFNTGGRYDPVTDTWTATSTVGAPSARESHTAVWTGSVMVVWGGYGYDGYLKTGGRYDPAADTWTATSTGEGPSARSGHTAIWTGSVMVVWGGSGANVFNTGGRYDPATDTWTTTSTVDAPTARVSHTAVWTGRVMVVWGGAGAYPYLNTGGRYDPITDTWTATSPVGAPSGRFGHTAVWTGRVMAVWGGGGDYPDYYLNTGGRYDPATDTWTTTSTVEAPSARVSHTAVWTGSAMVVWGGDAGSYDFNTGGRYDPATDTWAATSTLGAPSPRYGYTAVRTGNAMVVWGGSDSSYDFNTGGRYDPATDSWTATSTVGAPSWRYGHTAVWTGNVMVVWGGYGYYGELDTGGRYDPATDTWRATSTLGAPSARDSHTAIWTGRVMVVWGGLALGSLNTGGRYVLGGGAPPVADAGPDQTLECTGGEQATAALDGSGSTDCDSTPGTNDEIASFEWSESGTPLASGERVTASFHLGVHDVTLTVTDRAGTTATDGVVISVQDTTPPVITCPAPITIECQGNLQAMVTLPPATATDVCQSSGLVIANTFTPNGANASASYPLGTTTVTFTATDAAGNDASCQTTITVRDTIPPVVTSVSSPNVLWPPNHRMVTVNNTVVATDICDPSPVIILTAATSNEPDDAPGGGDGNTTDDIQGAALGTPDFQVLLRAERDGNGPGRVYTMTYRATDVSGNATNTSSVVTVPHDMRDLTVEPLNLLMRDRNNTEVIWGPVDGAQRYDVIRGDLANRRVMGSNVDLGQVVCIEHATTSTTTAGYGDAEVPESGHVFFYAVQYFDGVQDSSYGSESTGTARVIQPGNGDCQ